MADNMTGRAERPEFHDNDPFAELTRIMGHDPRQDAPGHDEGDLALDLENELLGDLDLRTEDATETVSVSDAQSDAVPEPEWEELPQEGPATREVEDYSVASSSAEDARSDEMPAQPADDFAVDLDFSDFDAELGAAFERGLDDETALPEGDEPAFAEETVEPSADWAAMDRQAADLPASSDVAPVDEAPFGQQVEEWQPPVLDAADATQDDVWSDQEIAVADWEIGEGSDEQPLASSLVVEPNASSGADEAAIGNFEFDEELLRSLEEEPAAAEGAAIPFDDIPAYADEPPVQEEAVAAAALKAAPAVAETPEKPKQLSLEEELTILLAGADRPHAEPAAAFAAPAAPRPAEPPVQAAATATARTSWASRPAPAAEREVPEIETVEMAGFEPIRSAEFDIPELPVEEPVQATSEFDDITAEFSRAFETSDVAERAADESSYNTDFAMPDQAPSGQSDFDWDAATAVSPAGAAFRPDGHGRTEHGYFDDAAPAGGMDGQEPAAHDFSLYRNDDALGDEMPADRPVLRDNRRRNMMVAGGALALVLLGGVGVFALWSGGGSGGEPVLLQADGEPVRVRPEEPGGAVVPNQDSEVYQRVAGGREEAEPSQARLIDTAEEPIDLTVQNAPRIVGADDNAGFGSDLSAVKVEDRLESGGEETAANASDDMVALQPRRVRTMVVRPDGSIVPREDPEPAAAPSSESEPAATAPQSLTPSSNAAAEEPAAAAEATTDMPEEIALAPATRPAPEQQPAAATPPAPEPAPAPAQAPQQEQQVAAVSPTPAAPQATQTSEWSMQIASQPSSESAQTTYQDLARRYSSLLEGRGVNIVRAEVDGRTFYRVRIPMATRDEAVNLCTRYQQAGGSCFVSR